MLTDQHWCWRALGLSAASLAFAVGIADMAAAGGMLDDVPQTPGVQQATPPGGATPPSPPGAQPAPPGAVKIDPKAADPNAPDPKVPDPNAPDPKAGPPPAAGAPPAGPAPGAAPSPPKIGPPTVPLPGGATPPAPPQTTTPPSSPTPPVPPAPPVSPSPPAAPDPVSPPANPPGGAPTPPAGTPPVPPAVTPPAGVTPPTPPGPPGTPPGGGATPPATVPPAVTPPAVPPSGGPPAVPPSGTKQTTPPAAKPAPGGGMLDDISDSEGQMIVVPGTGGTPPTTAAPAPPAGVTPPPGGTPPPGVTPPAVPPVATPPAPPATPPAPAVSVKAAPPLPPQALKDIVAGVMAEGVYMSPPTAGSQVGKVLEDAAKQCKVAPADLTAYLRAANRNVVHVAKMLPPSDQKAPGKALAVTASPSSAKPSPAISCIAPPKAPAELRLEFLVSGRDFGLGPTESVSMPLAGVAKDAAALNAVYGDPARPWRLARPEELLAITSVMFGESLWGPDGGEYWTAASLPSGEGIVVKTTNANQTFEAELVVRPATERARPVWVRDGLK